MISTNQVKLLEKQDCINKLVKLLEKRDGMNKSAKITRRQINTLLPRT